MVNHRSFEKEIRSYPRTFDPKSLYEKTVMRTNLKFVVLDDDPTGVQTVHGVHVYTDWTYESMKEAFEEPESLFFILTNSRGMTEEETTRIHHEIIDVISKVSAETYTPYLYISRSDSTLRGHFPLETEILKEGLLRNYAHVDGEILYPFFPEGGRYTVDNIHFAKYGDDLVPCAETEFAKDATFGFSSSSLPEYIEEKTAGKFKAEDVTCISLKDLREGNIDRVYEQLMQVKDFGKVIVNSLDYDDVKTFCIALFKALHDDKVFVFRTAAGFVKCAGGIPDKHLLTRDEMIHEESLRGGIVAVGSHTAKTTAQLEELLKLENTQEIAFRSSAVLESDEVLEQEIMRCIHEAESVIREGKTAVCYTERTLLSFPGDTKEEALVRSVKISDALQRIVRDLNVKPAFVVAKGGITSSDIGVKALHVKKALVLGQIRPGIPVWKTDDQSRFPGIPYIIFPGNVGENTTLREAVEILTGK